MITEVAIQWLDSIRDKTKPFCLFGHHKAPHRTWMPDTCDLSLYEDVTYPMPTNFYDDYEGREAVQVQKMSIGKDMDIVYDLKMADKENEIHSNARLEKWGRQLYAQMTPEQRATWDAYYDPITAKIKKDRPTGKMLDAWKYQRYMHDYCRVITSIDRNVGRVISYLKTQGLLNIR